MCLYLKGLQIVPRIATKDITVFKSLQYAPFIKKWTTPFQQFEVPDNGVMIPDEKLSLFILICNIMFKEVEEGYIHAYTKYENNLQLTEAYIPKGTLYFRGKNNEIAARKIIIRKFPKI